jgi:DNA-directed RNA polymerase subunit K
MMFFYDALTRFEKTRIISARALQISMGAPVLIKTDLNRPKDIAAAEFEKNVLPITVKREMPKRH